MFILILTRLSKYLNNYSYCIQMYPSYTMWYTNAGYTRRPIILISKTLPNNLLTGKGKKRAVGKSGRYPQRHGKYSRHCEGSDDETERTFRLWWFQWWENGKWKWKWMEWLTHFSFFFFLHFIFTKAGRLSHHVYPSYFIILLHCLTAI